MVEAKAIHSANTQVCFAQTSAGILQKATGYDKKNLGTLVRRSLVQEMSMLLTMERRK